MSQPKWKLYATEGPNQKSADMPVTLNRPLFAATITALVDTIWISLAASHVHVGWAKQPRIKHLAHRGDQPISYLKVSMAVWLLLVTLKWLALQICNLRPRQPTDSSRIGTCYLHIKKPLLFRDCSAVMPLRVYMTGLGGTATVSLLFELTLTDHQLCFLCFGWQPHTFLISAPASQSN